MPPPPLLNVGQWNFQRLESSNAFRLSFGLRWIDSERREPRLYTVSVIDDTRSFDRQLAIFRHTLWIWLGGTVVALIAILLLILRWSLAPLKQLGREQIGRAHVCTPVTNAHLVCRLLLENKKKNKQT